MLIITCITLRARRSSLRMMTVTTHWKLEQLTGSLSIFLLLRHRSSPSKSYQYVNVNAVLNISIRTHAIVSRITRKPVKPMMVLITGTRGVSLLGSHSSHLQERYLTKSVSSSKIRMRGAMSIHTICLILHHVVYKKCEYGRRE